MTAHPCDGLSDAAIRAFENISINQAPQVSKKTLDALERRGLIARLPDKIIGADRFGSIKIADYCVPLLVHMQWCEWCAENYDE